jgi:hypothetical protein
MKGTIRACLDGLSKSRKKLDKLPASKDSKLESPE